MPSATFSPITLLGGIDRSWNDEILAASPELRSGCRPKFLVRSGHTQAALSLLHDDRAPDLVWDHDERLVLEDGGTVSLQWAGLSADPATPVLVVMHTICGSGATLRRFVAAMRRRLGWVVVVCNRRGHAGLPLTAPRINTMGFVGDLEAQLDAIEARRPGTDLYAAGISAGSGLLVRYLGEAAERSRFKAAVAMCPAYDIPHGLRSAHPRYDAYMVRRMTRFFLERNRDVLSGVAGFDRCLAARTMVEFHEHLYALAGFETLAAYEEASDPMRVMQYVTTPALVLNAEDDPVCSVVNVHRHSHAMQRLPRVMTALTRYGGHCGFFEGMTADTSWSDRAVAEFFSANHRMFAQARAGGSASGPT